MTRTIVLFCLAVLMAAGASSQAPKRDSSLEISSGYIDVNGGKLFYEAAGEGEYIVLLHDGSVHREIWDAQFPVLAKNYRVVRYDRRGYGKSPSPQAAYSSVDDLYGLFTQLQIDQAVIMGMSAGGGITVDFTLAHPEKVKAIVLVGAVVSGYPYSTHMLTRGGRLNSILDLFVDPDYYIKFIGWDDPYTINPENVKAKERCLQLLKANRINVNPDKYTFARPPARPAVNNLAEIKVPALVLVGEYDIPDVHAQSGVIEVGIPGAKRQIIPECGHLIPLDQPELFNASVLTFLNNREFMEILNSDGVNAAVEYFHKKRKNEPGVIVFEENDMNALGYRYLQNGNIKEAIELFKLNTTAYPNSANVFDSLGEAYLADGQRDLAVKNYEKSLELNPENVNAQRVVRELRGE